MALTWNDNLLTGMAEIDEQHKELLAAINRFFDACDRGKGREEIREMFSFLEHYIISHFAAEELYMDAHNYKNAVAHKKLHEDFRKNFEVLKKKLESSLEDASLLQSLRVQIETNWLLGEWWINHINNVDKQLGAFLKSQTKK